MARVASQGATHVLKGLAQQCRGDINRVIENCQYEPGTDESDDKLGDIDRQLEFMIGATFPLTQAHCVRLEQNADGLLRILSKHTNGITDRDTWESFSASLEDWSYKFEPCWFLYTLYFESPETSVANLMHVLHQTPSNTPMERWTDDQLKRHLPILNSTLRYMDSEEADTRSILPLVFNTETTDGPPITLRKALLSENDPLFTATDFSLPKTRADFATSLAEAIHSLHICDVQHGMITPDCILVTENGDDQYNPLLAGFQSIPTKSPGWQGTNGPVNVPQLYHLESSDDPEWDSMRNDIRNLGVCLIELGYPKSFQEFEETNTIPGALWPIAAPDVPGVGQAHENLASHLLALAETLVIDMGCRYVEVVKTCLRVGDLWPVVKSADDKIDLAIWFVDEVVLKLHAVDVDVDVPDDVHDY
ncbi:unnamed protein product [Clonostachys rosea]|uniref:Protein kinase domain-containing protein n=1 Tax=Bionectria ochroleuca TaxID=29856 RepID=A0ABY6U8X4_BIOOC|nr:unnamed protein product [Clonostachys rosea]